MEKQDYNKLLFESVTKLHKESNRNKVNKILMQKRLQTNYQHVIEYIGCRKMKLT